MKVAHLMKYTKASCGHMFAHYDRKAKNISNENLDRSRTHLNYNLITHQQEHQGEFIRKRCSDYMTGGFIVFSFSLLLLI